MQRQVIPQGSLASDPERLARPDLGVRQLFERMTLGILELQCHRLPFIVWEEEGEKMKV